MRQIGYVCCFGVLASGCVGGPPQDSDSQQSSISSLPPADDGCSLPDTAVSLSDPSISLWGGATTAVVVVSYPVENRVDLLDIYFVDYTHPDAPVVLAWARSSGLELATYMHWHEEILHRPWHGSGQAPGPKPKVPPDPHFVCVRLFILADALAEYQAITEANSTSSGTTSSGGAGGSGGTGSSGGGKKPPVLTF